MSGKENLFKKLFHDLGTYTGSALVAGSPGMRVIKTVLAVLICFTVDWFRAADTPYNAAIAAIVCLQPNMQSTWESSLNRAVGTFLAGLYAYLFLLVFEVRLNLDMGSALYPFLVAVGLLPLMLLILKLGFKSGFAISSIVFLLICVGSGHRDPLLFTLSRVFDTLIGIAAALFVNWLPFLNHWGEKLSSAKARARHRKTGAGERLRRILGRKKDD